MNDHLVIREMPPEERPREKMMNQGAGALSNAELIAIIIRTGTSSLSALGLAEKVLAMEDSIEFEEKTIVKREKGLSFLWGCIPEELTHTEGIGMAKACQIVAAVELGKRIAAMPRTKRITINNSKDISSVMMARMRHLKKENFNVAILNTKHEIMTIDNISVGNINSSVAYPREVFEKALRKGGAAIILAHNHPSGSPEPSKEDIDVTLRLVEAGELLGIEVLDHLIIGDGEYTSLKEQGLF